MSLHFVSAVLFCPDSALQPAVWQIECVVLLRRPAAKSNPENASKNLIEIWEKNHFVFHIAKVKQIVLFCKNPVKLFSEKSDLFFCVSGNSPNRLYGASGVLTGCLRPKSPGAVKPNGEKKFLAVWGS